jgi:hypothetical protein
MGNVSGRNQLGRGVALLVICVAHRGKEIKDAEIGTYAAKRNGRNPYALSGCFVYIIQIDR